MRMYEAAAYVGNNMICPACGCRMPRASSHNARSVVLHAFDLVSSLVLEAGEAVKTIALCEV